ncbi:1-acyl-sn-glycerol-3-phosphate acyltransferase [Pleionea sp. CnH1-48]|uniref:lysophospholipid acyltransferase family protein n=1 Tax=Pleionea sp. CnH1-48 TaxID=2954494 RepID=UPI0020982304|nr:lysophospholipid acyltransferase family protein [Pleionea sp. CnH1-48]MCO7222682.1 1-acyl-sn-glycerol-3-phosphate acyltransferase [Pleionea sp. CnH1-48]
MSIDAVSGVAKKSRQRAGRLLTVLITIATWLITIWYCFKAIIFSSFSKNARMHVDIITREWSQSLVNLIRLRIHVSGDFDAQYQSGKPCIVMCNHSSAYDIPVSFLAIPGSLRMLAKKELFRIPIFSQAMRASEFLSIDRQDKDQAIRDLATAKEKMEDGIILWVAPEGTRSKEGELLPFKKGGFHLAIETGATIVPVVIKDIHQVLPTKTFRMSISQDIEVRIGDAIDATDYDISERGQLVDAVHQSMDELLKPALNIDSQN